MQYQLPNGRVLYLSIEEYLSLSDEELTYLSVTQIGDFPSYSMHYCNHTPKETQTIIPENDFDYTPESDGNPNTERVNLDNLPDEQTT